ncbi:MAG: hypothetical protein H8D56_03085 [Planctomycetes bacterium]|nr:hypothetical protein [Planctomycetota bacterium]MBL7146090.1 hypothetical protein [Phycisphaerae bacterium]
MKRAVFTSVIGVWLLMLAIFFSGCAENRINLVDNGLLTLEKQASGKVYIDWCDAYKDEKGITVTGVLRRRDHIGLPIKKHVDVTILSPEGTILDKASSPDYYIPRDIIGRFEKLQRFTVCFPNVPPQGSVVRVIASNG